VATIGEKLGDPYAPFDENAYVNRLILSADPVAGSITLFEPDFRPGARVQVMSRDNALMLDSAHRGAAALFERTVARPPSGGPEPLLALYIDCAGRASLRSGAAVEEAELVLAQAPATVPFIGFYSGVEVAPFAGDSRPLDWTGVLTVLRR
jgi:small ligand-binding sensory domain FIST